MPMLTITLKFKKEAPTYVEGLDDQGFVRAFDRDTHRYQIDGDVLIVDVDQRAWERRMKRKPVVRPTKLKKTVKRKCLLCKSEFEDQPQMRICQPCKNTAEWHNGDDGYTCHL